MEKEILEEIKKHSILCVEDEDGIRKRLLNIFSYYFDEIYESASGKEAYKIYTDYKPDIIFTDIQMNNGDGIELINRIRETDINTKIIVLTAYSSEEYLLNLINSNISHYILKPFSADKLKTVLKKILKEKFDCIIELASNLNLNLATREIKYNESTILVRKREKEFLRLLYNNKNRKISSYCEIEETVWGNSYMSSSALKTFIRDLRKKLPLDIIVNVPQEGYKLK